MTTTIAIPTYPIPKKEEVPIKQTAVEKSLARPDAFAKPCSVGNAKVRMRLTSPNAKSGRQRKRKRDPRDVKFY